MNNTLKIITDALEKTNFKLFYKTRVLLEPLLIHAFKKVIIELYSIDETGTINKIIEASSIERVTNEDEKLIAIDKCTTELLSLIFKQLYNNEISLIR